MTKNEMITQIKSELGGSQVNIEVPDEDISGFIDRAVGKISPHIQDTDYITKPVGNTIDLSDENVIDVVKIYPNSSTTLNRSKIDLFRFRNLSDVSMRDYMHYPMKRSQMEDLINRSFKYDDTEKKLYLDDYWGGSVTIEVMTSVTLETLKDQDDIDWVFEYSKALTMEALANVRGKFRVDGTPYETDADDLRSRSQTRIDSLEDDLDDKGFFVMVR